MYLILMYLSALKYETMSTIVLHPCLFMTTLLNGIHTGKNNITIVYQHLQAKHKMDDYYQSKIAEMMRAI